MRQAKSLKLQSLQSLCIPGESNFLGRCFIDLSEIKVAFPAFILNSFLTKNEAAFQEPYIAAVMQCL